MAAGDGLDNFFPIVFAVASIVVYLWYEWRVLFVQRGYVPTR